MKEQFTGSIVQDHLTRCFRMESARFLTVNILPDSHPRNGSGFFPQISLDPLWGGVAGREKQDADLRFTWTVRHERPKFDEAGAGARTARMREHNEGGFIGIETSKTIDRPLNGSNARCAGQALIAGQAKKTDP